jgi:hypothetical protein
MTATLPIALGAETVPRIMQKLSVLLALLLAAPGVARAQVALSNPYSYLSAATTNSTLVYAGPSLLQGLIIGNTTATTYFLKLYNKALAPVCGTDVPVMRIPIPPNTVGGIVAVSTDAVAFPLGLGFCLTGALPDADTTNAATGVALNLSIIWQ